MEVYRYDDSSSVTYSNSAAGRLLTRTWARGIVTTYGYNPAGDLSVVAYSDTNTATQFTTALLRAVGADRLSTFLRQQDACVKEALQRGGLTRCAHWTGSVAVGSEEFIRRVAAQMKGRQRLPIEACSQTEPGATWTVREPISVYSFGPRKRVMNSDLARNGL